nr:hypothetical protein [Tanacetum cinerariifolium]
MVDKNLELAAFNTTKESIAATNVVHDKRAANDGKQKGVDGKYQVRRKVSITNEQTKTAWEFDIDDDGVTNGAESDMNEDVVCNPNINENKHYRAKSCKGHAHHVTYANLFNTESKQVNNEVRSNTGGVSDSSDVKSDGEINVIKRVDFRSLVNEEKVENTDTVLPMSAIEKVKNMFDNSLMDTLNEEVIENVFERGPWIIRNTPLILNRWTPNVSLKIDEVTKVPVWVKLHNVPVVAYSADGRINFARALVEINAGSDLKHEVSMAIPLEDRTGHTRGVIKVEYEWRPPHCNDCKIFSHTNNKCPNRVILETF